MKSNKQPFTPQMSQAMVQCNSNEDVWLQTMATHQEASYWPPDILHMNAMNQSLSNCNGRDWYSDVPVNRRPVTRQTSLELCSKSNCKQVCGSC